MEDQTKYHRYMEWKTPEEMHFSCLQWISYLDFIRDENKFFEDVLKEYTLPVLEAHLFDRAKEIVNKLSVAEQHEKELTSKLISHRNDLKVIVDEKDQPESEKKYTEEHRALNNEVGRFMEDHRKLKKEIFEMISITLKKQKQNNLLT